MFRSLLVTTALVLPGPLLAQATTEGAATLASQLQRYLPPGAEGLTVAANGADYLVTFDLNGFLRQYLEQGLLFEATPFTLTLTEAEGGTYSVRYDQAFTGKLVGPNVISVDLAIDRIAGTGTFDPALGAFAQHELSYTGLSYEQAAGPEGRDGKVVYHIDHMEMTSAAKSNPAGGIDLVSEFSASGIREDLTMPSPAGLQPWTAKIASPTYTGQLEATGVRSLELLELTAHVLPNLPLEANGRDQVFRDKLAAAAPFFEKISGQAVLTDVTVDTELGIFGARELGVDVEIGGAVAEGHFSETFTVHGLSLPAGLVPEWTAGLIPENSGIAFEVTGFDLAAPLAIFLDRISLRDGPDSVTEMELFAALLPNSSIQMGLAADADRAERYTLSIDSDMAIGQASMPVGTATISLTGIDEILTEINKAPEEIKQSAIPAISMARGLGKLVDGATVWEVEMTADGKLLVNGNDLSMFMQ